MVNPELSVAFVTSKHTIFDGDIKAFPLTGEREDWPSNQVSILLLHQWRLSAANFGRTLHFALGT